MDFSNATILCLGDVMLDRFAYCDTERISPEAPVPVLLLQRTQSMLGGAGNVARNIAALGGTAILMGLIGQDAAGAELRTLIAADAGLVDRHVTSAAAADDLQDPLHGRAPAAAAGRRGERARPRRRGGSGAGRRRRGRRSRQADAVILSDYGKSVLGAARAGSRDRAGARPRHSGLCRSEERGFPALSRRQLHHPQLRELAAAARLPVASDAEVIAAATKVMQDSGVDAILATRSEKGMVLVEASGAVHIEAARAREVYDVSGAGDTVVAVLALAHAAGYALPQAMRLANTAAGIVVSKLGTATVELDELMLELARDVRDKAWHHAKHFSAAEAETLVRRWKSRGLKVGFTNGCFDILHAGHVALLAAARAQCDRLIVALNDDAGVRRLKGPKRPVNGLADRAAVIAAVELVDAVISFDEDTPLELIRRLRPDVLVKGGDYTVETVVGAEEVQATGGRVVLVDLVEGHSTTGLIDAIRTAPPRARRGRTPRDAGDRCW